MVEQKSSEFIINNGGGGSCLEAGSRILGVKTIETFVRRPKLRKTKEIFETITKLPVVQRTEEILHLNHILRETVQCIERPVEEETVVELNDIEFTKSIDSRPDKDKKSIDSRPDKDKKSIDSRSDKDKKSIDSRPDKLGKKKTRGKRYVEEVHVEYRDVPIERIVEVPEIHEKIVIVKKMEPQKVPYDIAEVTTVEEEKLVVRSRPVPLEAVKDVDFELPLIEEQTISVDLPIYVPRFIEVPCPVEFLDAETISQIQCYALNLTQMSLTSCNSLLEVEALAACIQNLTLNLAAPDPQNTNKLWQSGQINVLARNS